MNTLKDFKTQIKYQLKLVGKANEWGKRRKGNNNSSFDKGRR